MKIGIDCRMYSSNFTGIGRYTFELVKHLIKINKANNYPHEYILFFNNPEFKDFETSKNVKKVLVNAKHYSLAEQLRFNRVLKKEKLDTVHFPHFNIPILYRRPYTVTIHDLTLSLYPGQKMTKWYQRLAYHLIIRNAVRKARHIIAITQNTKNDIIRFLRTPSKKITTIYNGIGPEFKFIHDANEFTPTLKKYKIATPFLLYTGNWRSHKNLPRLIKAFKLLKEKHNSPLSLVLTGKPDPFYPEVKQSIKELDLADHVITPGLVSEKELIHLYNAAFIYVFPSLYEGFGLPPLEAMSCGTPTAVAFTSSIPEVCTDHAVYFDPYNEEDIAEQIHTLHKDPDLQAKLIDTGLQHVKKFTWKKAAEQSYKIITAK